MASKQVLYDELGLDCNDLVKIWKSLGISLQYVCIYGTRPINLKGFLNYFKGLFSMC